MSVVATYLLLLSRALLATVFLLAVVGKAGRRVRFARFVLLVQRVAGLSRRRAVAVAVGVTACEAVVVGLLALPVAPRVGLAGAAGLLILFVAVILRSVRSGASEPCNCFGDTRTRMSYPLVVRNLLLVAVAAVGLAVASGAGPVSPIPAALTVAAGALLALAVLAHYDAAAGAARNRADRPGCAAASSH